MIPSRNQSMATSRKQSMATSRKQSMATSRKQSMATSRQQSMATSRKQSMATSMATIKEDFSGSDPGRRHNTIWSKRNSTWQSTYTCFFTRHHGSMFEEPVPVENFDPTAGPGCIRHSPGIVTRDLMTGSKMELEARLWRETFDAQGELYRMQTANIKAKKEKDECGDNPLEDPRKKAISKCVGMGVVPYHCPFKTEQTVVGICRLPKGLSTKKPPPPDPITPETWPVVERKVFPRVKPDLQDRPGRVNEGTFCSWSKKTKPETTPSNNMKQETTPATPIRRELPVTSVTVTWSPDRKFTDEDIFDWLRQFGQVWFVTPKDECAMYVTYDTMVSAHGAVNFPRTPRGVAVAWSNVKFYNFGEIQPFGQYQVSKDPKYRGIFKKILKTPNMEIYRL